MRRLNDKEEQHAQQIACGHLIRGCEGAITELRATGGETSGLPRTNQRAQEILAHVLSTWRDAMSDVAPSQEPLRNDNTLERWTSEELFAEALTRQAGDGPALRVMQSRTLKAQLTAHDSE